jgi:hypothetical protein
LLTRRGYENIAAAIANQLSNLRHWFESRSITITAVGVSYNLEVLQGSYTEPGASIFSLTSKTSGEVMVQTKPVFPEAPFGSYYDGEITSFLNRESQTYNMLSSLFIYQKAEEKRLLSDWSKF